MTLSKKWYQKMLNKKNFELFSSRFIYRFFENKECTGLPIDELNTVNKEEVNFPRFAVNLIPFYSLFFFYLDFCTA